MQNPMNPMMQAQMPRGPNMNGPQFGSPAVSHLGLPGGLQGSPHVSGGAGQRRRPSTAKVEDEGEGVGKGPKVKASPKAGNKRQKATS